MMGFFYFFSGFVTIIYLYSGFRIIPTLAKKPHMVVAWAVLLVLLAALILHFYFRINRTFFGLSKILAWAGYLGFGVVSYLFLFALARDILAILSLITLKSAGLFSKAPQELLAPDRRQVLWRISGVAITALSASAGLTGFVTALKLPEIVQVNIPVSPDHAHLKGLTIAQFSDLHIGPTLGRSYVEKVCNAIRGLKADLIVFTGDLVDGTVHQLENEVLPLTGLHAPLGKYFITGNHEYYSGVRQWVEKARDMGFDPLINEHRILPYNGGVFTLAGVTDLHGGAFYPDHAPDVKKALKGAPDHAFKLLLAHQPESVYDAATVGVDLQLSGHTHGGQYFPFNHVIKLRHPFIKGLYQHKDTRLYVSQGTGYWGPPLRLGTFPEITVFSFI